MLRQVLDNLLAFSAEEVVMKEVRNPNPVHLFNKNIKSSRIYVCNIGI
jgi:hypothetical protein